jgi:beta-glucosidase
MDEHQSNFPKDFWWGASTSSHQVEGGNHNQWTVWELAHAKELAQTAHQKYSQLPNWEDIRDDAENPSNYVSGEAVDHWNRYKTDFDIIEKLNLNAFRFSIEWSRIEPEEGKWNEEAIEHYREYIKELRRRKIEPFLNIWHYSLPVWFTGKGGFEKRHNIKYFNRFIEKVSEELIDDVAYVITLNEPNVYSGFSYLIAGWPPAGKNPLSFIKVYRNLVKAHKDSYKILKKKKPALNVGLASQLANIQAKRPHNLMDILATQWMRYFWNWWFLNKTKRHQDFVGINYYYTDYYTGFVKRKNPTVPLSDVGAYMEPEGLYSLILRVWSHYKKPIIITESGVADAHDQHRRWWLEESMIAMEKAVSEGVEVKGYFYWSLLDNFEWAFGSWPKYGLVEVDRKTMKRKIRPSAKWFGETVKKIRQNP